MIFSHGGLAAADVALCFVDGKHLPHLLRQRRIHCRQTLCGIFMNAGFADAEFNSGLPHGASSFDQIISDAAAAFLDVLLQLVPLPTMCICTCV